MTANRGAACRTLVLLTVAFAALSPGVAGASTVPASRHHEPRALASALGRVYAHCLRRHPRRHRHCAVVRTAARHRIAREHAARIRRHRHTAAAHNPGEAGTPATPGAASATDPAFEPGLNSGIDLTWDVPGAADVGAKVVRIAANVWDNTAEMEPVFAAYADRGIRILLLADFHGTLPTPAQAANLASWARVFGPGGSFWADRTDGGLALSAIEFGNETSFEYQYSDDSPAGYATRAETYALRFAEAAQAVKAANPQVGLLAQGDPGNSGQVWVRSMFRAVPDLATLVAGWTIHPYGDHWRWRIEDMLSQLAEQGAPASIPVDITEWGLTTDDGDCLKENFGWNSCMTYAEAAQRLTSTVSEMKTLLGERMGLFVLYQVRDQAVPGATTEPEGYFGALQHELKPKGAYTAAVQALMAS